MADTKTDRDAGLTERQRKWFASVRASLEASTGRTLEDWVAIVRTCPETAPRRRAAWLKSEHGLGQNYAACVLDRAFASGAPGWDEPAALRAALWSDAASLAILQRLETVAAGLGDGLVRSQRKSFTAWSRAVQFAAARPLKGGGARLGLKLEPDASPRLAPNGRSESWSERLTAVADLEAADRVDAEIARLFAAAAARG